MNICYSSFDLNMKHVTHTRFKIWIDRYIAYIMFNLLHSVWPFVVLYIEAKEATRRVAEDAQVIGRGGWDNPYGIPMKLRSLEWWWVVNRLKRSRPTLAWIFWKGFEKGLVVMFSMPFRLKCAEFNKCPAMGNTRRLGTLSRKFASILST